MASATLSSPFSTFETNSNDLQDDSFSSYLALIRESISTDLANPSLQISSAPKMTKDDMEEEIDVFGAEKYFSGSLDFRDYSDITSESNKKSEKKNKSSEKYRSTSTCSEASANSGSILLRSQKHQPQASSVTRRRRFLDVLWSYCSKKNVVKAEDDASSSKLPTHFGREMESSGSLTALESESSSELFEIDNLLSVKSYPLYEPSEASIEWSVTTASAANLSSVAAEKAKGGKKRQSLGLLLGR